jgi:methylmalonyl-CoA mutase C-terminal domain/subunit
MAAGTPIRVLLSKVGLDTHDRGIKLVAVWLRNAGMEIIDLGPYRSAEEVAVAAAQEDVDVIGTSYLDGGHIGWTQDLIEHLRILGADDVRVVVGGTIPHDDVPVLLAMGVSSVILPGTPMTDVVAAVEAAARSRTA